MAKTREQIRADADTDVAEFAELIAAEQSDTTGIPPEPEIKVTEINVDPEHFNFGVITAPEPVSVLPTSGSGGCLCVCPRECDEITGFTMSFTATYTSSGGCTSGGCADTQTWTRIPSTDPFSAPHQFKLYLSNCASFCGEIVYEDNRAFSPIGFDCSDGSGNHASFVFGSNFPNTGGCCLFVTVGNVVFITLDFFAEGDNACGNCVAELGDLLVNDGNVCDMSTLIGVYPVSKTCAVAGGQWQIDALLEWF